MPRSALGIRKAPEERCTARRGRPAIVTKVNDLIQLVYVSTAAPGLTQCDLDAIERSSGARNKAAGLTGLLLYQGGTFSGTLEGPERKVLARMEIIIRDPRHSRLRVLREVPILTRRFENWSFGSLPDVQSGERGEGLILSLTRGLR